MKQILQSLRDGTVAIEDVPAPNCHRSGVLVQSEFSLVSSGTERMLLEFGKGNAVQKIRSQPEKVREVINKVKTDGVLPTIDAVQAKLDQPISLGYCNVGRVIETNTSDFQVGDRIVSNGQHAEIVTVSKHLCARIPDNVTDEAASFTVLSAISLQGVRMTRPTLGENFVVMGLGLIGLLTVQILRANGCRVLGVDINPQRLEMAAAFGAETTSSLDNEVLYEKAMKFSRGFGVDGVIITAATKSSLPVSQAAKMCRKRGRIVLVGVTGLNLNRSDFYEKEISFQVSCSYGPGRYDQKYEEQGHDNQIGFVRWTEQRNFEAVLDLMSAGAIDVMPLITHRFDILKGREALGLLTSHEPTLGIILHYNREKKSKYLDTKINFSSGNDKTELDPTGSFAFLGAGNYAGRILIPAFKKSGVDLDTIISNTGVSAAYYGKKFGFRSASTKFDDILNNKSITSLVIATRHNLHAQQVLAGLKAGKNIFCEKPLCINSDELAQIKNALHRHKSQKLFVGFNRRFAPHVRKMQELLSQIGQNKSVIITVNAGEIPTDHWIQHPKIGGGRIIGEACHFIDLARYLVGSPIQTWKIEKLKRSNNIVLNDDIVTLNLSFEDGSCAAIHYLANGHKSFPKERIEVFTGGKILQLDNFRKLRGWGWNNFRKANLLRQNKGQQECVNAFVSSIDSGAEAPIPIAEIIEVTQVAIDLAEAARI